MQPWFDTQLHVVHFNYGYFDMPDGTVPYGDSHFTFVVKHGSVYNSRGGFIGSGTYIVGSGGTKLTNAFRLHEDGGYCHFFWYDDLVFGSHSANPSTVAVQYDGTTRKGWVNNTLIKQDNTSQRNSTIYNNTIGRTDPFFSQDLYGDLYCVFIFSTSLSTNDLTSLYTFAI